MKYLSILVLCAGLMDATAQAQQEVLPISEQERAALVSGICMGLDIARAVRGLEPMAKDKWMEFADLFDSATVGCQDIRCATDKIVALRETVYQMSLKRNKEFSPKGPEILR